MSPDGAASSDPTAWSSVDLFNPTSEHALLCIPLHIFSSIGRQELDHPMFNGTHVIDR